MLREPTPAESSAILSAVLDLASAMRAYDPDLAACFLGQVGAFNENPDLLRPGMNVVLGLDECFNP
jgi:hypothetical protein